MYTDVYFTNRTLNWEGHVGLAFFQKQTSTSGNASRVFQTLKQCPPGWSHQIRIFWDLNYRLVSSSGNISEPAVLSTIHSQEKKKFMLYKDGTLSMIQSFRNGCREIEFEQLKGRPCSGIRLYRGNSLIAELSFTTKVVSFRVDTTINLLPFFGGVEGDPVPKEADQSFTSGLSFDYTGIKEMELSFNAFAQKQLEIGKISRW